MAYPPSLSSNGAHLPYGRQDETFLSSSSGCEGDSSASNVRFGDAIESCTQRLMSFLRGASGSVRSHEVGDFELTMEKSRNGQSIRATDSDGRPAFEVSVNSRGKVHLVQRRKDLVTNIYALMVKDAVAKIAQELAGRLPRDAVPLSPALPAIGRRRQSSTIPTLSITPDAAPSSNMSLASSLNRMEPDHFSNKTRLRADSMDVDVVKPKPATKKTPLGDDKKENGLRSTLFVCAPTNDVAFLETMFEELLQQKLGDEKEVTRPCVTLVEEETVIDDADAYVTSLEQRWWKKKCIVRAPDGTPYLPYSAAGESCGCGSALRGVQLRCESTTGTFFKCWGCAEEQAKAQWSMVPQCDGGRLAPLQWDVHSWTPMFVKFNSQRDAKLVLSRLYQGALVTRAKKVKGWNSMARKEREKAIGFLSRPSDHAVPRSEIPQAEWIGAIGFTDGTLRNHVDLSTTVMTSVQAKVVKAAHNPPDRDAVGVPRAPTYTKSHCERRVVSVEAESTVPISVIEFHKAIRISAIEVDQPICGLVVQGSLDSGDSTLFHFPSTKSVTLKTAPLGARVFMYGAKILVNNGIVEEIQGITLPPVPAHLPVGHVTLPEPAVSYPTKSGRIDLHNASIRSFKVKPAPSELSQ